MPTLPATEMPKAPDAAPATDRPVAPAVDVATVGRTSGLKAATRDAIKVSPGKKLYKVAPGRHVTHGDDHETNGDGSVKKRGDVNDYGPGDEVELEEADAKRLIDLGFLLADDGSIVVHADGPAVNVEDGVQIATPR